jgi:hypothetical protein
MTPDPNTPQKGVQLETAPRLNPVLTLEQAQALLACLYLLFGPKAVFNLIEYGKKKAATEFKRLTWKQSQSPSYQKALIEWIRIGGNIGLVLGEKSGGIRAIDHDLVSEFERFPLFNRWTKRSIHSRSAHGGQFFFRMDEGAGLPNSQSYWPFYLKDEKDPIGELRLGPNCYSVVYGWLDPVESGDKEKGLLGPPDGVRYQLFGETLGSPEWKDIQWPDNYRLPWNEKPAAPSPPGLPPDPPRPSPSPDDPDDDVDPDDEADQGEAPNEKSWCDWSSCRSRKESFTRNGFGPIWTRLTWPWTAKGEAYRLTVSLAG